MKSQLSLVLTLLLIVACATDTLAQAYTDTIASGGSNNLPATKANLSFPTGVAVDTTGNFYIVVEQQHRVFKVDMSGNLTVVAGSGRSGFSGDGGLATNARLSLPRGVTVDGAGNLFIADTFNRRIRKVDANGIISTVAGNGNFGFSGDGGTATSAALDRPFGVAVDAADNLFIADHNNQRIRKVDTSGIISTVAGSGEFDFGDGGPATNAALRNPTGVAVDTTGNLFIADHNNQRIRKVDPSGIISTVAGNGTAGFSGDGGPGTNATLHSPQGVAVDAAGNLFIADLGNNRIRKVDPSGIISTVAGNGRFSLGDGGPATNASLRNPTDVAVDTAGNLFIADSSNDRVRKVDSSGIISTAAGNGTFGFSCDDCPVISTALHSPKGVAVDTAGNLFIADLNNNRRWMQTR